MKRPSAIFTLHVVGTKSNFELLEETKTQASDIKSYSQPSSQQLDKNPCAVCSEMLLVPLLLVIFAKG